MSSKPVIITLGLNDAPLKRGLDGVRGQMRLLQASAQQMGHSTVSTMQASSAAIRVLEGGITGNIRAAERFIGILPGIGSALQAAFPLIGGIALAGVFIKIGVEAAKFIQKMNEIPPNPFEGMIASGKIANDQLAISNDRLAMEIAKLEHKPVNGIALALDQARESSDKLFESLQKANAAFTEAMGKDSIGTFKGLWKNMAPTADAAKDITNARAGVQAVTGDHQTAIDDALASGNQQNVAQAREALMVDLQRAYQQQDAQLRAGLSGAQSRQAAFKGPYSVGSDQSKIIELYQSALAQSANEQKEAGGNYGQSVMQPQKDALDAAKANAEAAKQAQQAIVEAWRKNLDEQRTTFDDVLTQEARFWVQRMEESKKGSISYIAALNEANKAIGRMHQENVRAGREFDKLSTVNAPDLSRGDNGEMQKSGRDNAEWLKSLNQGIELQDANASAIANASLQMEVMTGRISALDAARVRQTMHEQEYLKALEAVNRARAVADSLPEGAYKAKTISDLDSQRGQIETTHTIQSAQDQQAVGSQQLGTAASQTLSRMGQDWSSMTSAIVQVMTRGIDNLNGNIAAALTGHGKKGDFGRSLGEAGQGLVRAGLQKGESELIGAIFGKGKGQLGASQANPMWVQMAGSGTASGASSSGVAAKLGSLVPGGSFIQPFIKSAIGLLPHFAAGGSFSAGQDFVAGEGGQPEIIHAGSAGSVTPMSKMGAGGDLHIHVDARGSNDPSAINAAVMRAAPHIVAASSHTEHQRHMRSPRGR